MNILVVGGQGQVALSLVERARAHAGLSLAALGRPEVDLEVAGSARAAILRHKPDLVVNAAAYTAVDKAEDEPARAFRINADAAGEIAAAASEIGCPIVHLSTDYVFDGAATRPLVESDPVGPINVYGRSKLAGEEQVRNAAARHIILRTSWVYSPFGSNFVRTMLRLAAERDEVAVVADQRGCPTSALDLADAILDIGEGLQRGSDAGLGETFHLCGPWAGSWAEYADRIFAASAAFGGPVARVRPIATSDYPVRATRPTWSVLDCGKFAGTFDYRMSDASLNEVVKSLVEGQDRVGSRT